MGPVWVTALLTVAVRPQVYSISASSFASNRMVLMTAELGTAICLKVKSGRASQEECQKRCCDILRSSGETSTDDRHSRLEDSDPSAATRSTSQKLRGCERRLANL